MAGRRKRTSVPNDPFSKDPFAAGAVLVALIVLIWPMWGILLILVGLLGLGGYYFLVYRPKVDRLKRTGILDIDQMDGKAFEERLWLLFTQLGYHVEPTQYVGDYGADLILTKKGERTVVQAKRYSSAVGLHAVQEVVTSKAKYASTGAIVVTNSSYTNAAKELARHNGVELWDRERLIKKLDRTSSR